MEQPEKEHAHEITVILNGSETKVLKQKYSYEEIFKLAWPNDSIPTDDAQPITYKMQREHKTHDLLPGDKPIELKEGMIIDVTPSTKS
jgi:hypothetical protein